MIFPRFSRFFQVFRYFPDIFSRFSQGLSTNLPRFSKVFPRFFQVFHNIFPSFFQGFSTILPKFSKVFLRCHGFPKIFRLCCLCSSQQSFVPIWLRFQIRIIEFATKNEINKMAFGRNKIGEMILGKMNQNRNRFM
jgi:hypothetical protein